MYRWMASLKAKNIILISRSGMKSESALCMARELQQAGVRLKAYACDVSDLNNWTRPWTLRQRDASDSWCHPGCDGFESKSPAPSVVLFSRAMLGAKRERELHLTMTGHLLTR